MPTPLTPEDLLRFDIPTEIALSPDGHYLAYSLLSQDAEKNERHSAVWLIDRETGNEAPRRFTTGTHRDRQIAWAPDGHWLAFVSDREGGSQVWLMPTNGGEPSKLTHMRDGASHPIWSPDGTQIAFLAQVSEGHDPLGLPDDEKQKKEEADRLRHITRLQYRWDGADISEGRTHLWVIDVAEFMAGHAEANTLTPRQITSGDFDHDEAAWSPDGTQIAFVSDRADDRDANVNNDLWVLTLANDTLTAITRGQNDVSLPAWSPDGKSLAWYSRLIEAGHSYSNRHVYVAHRDDQGNWAEPRDLLTSHDLTLAEGALADIYTYQASAPAWFPDGSALAVPALERGETHLWHVSLGGEMHVLTTGPHQIAAHRLTPDGTQVLTILLRPEGPPEIAEFTIDVLDIIDSERQLTDLNPWLSERYVVTPERFDFDTTDGWHLEGWVLRPPEEIRQDWQPHPVILQIHGGPHGFFGPVYTPIMQLFAGAGYAVIFMNPRGSVGYGEVFARACDRDWGGNDYSDIMAGLDAALTERDDLDADRMAVTGTSYGGYMTNWVTGHTGRFKAAVTINSVSNLLSCFGTGDIDATFGIPEYGGTPWERRDYYLERSPITYAPEVTTPTRIIGAERDWRCPIEQSEQWYTALKSLGRTEVDFLRVPGASHSINSGTPQQRVAQRKAILEWIQRFIR